MNHEIKQKFKCENCGCEIFNGGNYNDDGPHDATCIKCGQLHCDISIAYDFGQDSLNTPKEPVYDKNFMLKFIRNLYQEQFPDKAISEFQSNVDLLKCMQELSLKHNNKDYLTQRYDEYAQSLTENERQEFERCREEFYKSLMEYYIVKKVVLGKELL